MQFTSKLTIINVFSPQNGRYCTACLQIKGSESLHQNNEVQTSEHVLGSRFSLAGRLALQSGSVAGILPHSSLLDSNA